jgi:hypothetical protein
MFESRLLDESAANGTHFSKAGRLARVPFGGGNIERRPVSVHDDLLRLFLCQSLFKRLLERFPAE